MTLEVFRGRHQSEAEFADFLRAKIRFTKFADTNREVEAVFDKIDNFVGVFEFETQSGMFVH